jgi:hypothetical protein
VQFVGLGDQLRWLPGLLAEAVAGRTAGMLAVRGRRQVGKLRLFTRLVGDAGVPSVFFTAMRNAPAPQQLAVVGGPRRY